MKKGNNNMHDPRLFHYIDCGPNAKKRMAMQKSQIATETKKACFKYASRF